MRWSPPKGTTSFFFCRTANKQLTSVLERFKKNHQHREGIIGMSPEMEVDYERLMSKGNDHHHLADVKASTEPKRALEHLQLAKEFWSLANALKQDA